MVFSGVRHIGSIADFDTLLLSQLPTLVAHSDLIPRFLPRVNLELAMVVFHDSLDLLEWLRTSCDDDREFASAVEIAMGKDEIQTPVELWDPTGRVDEQKLSMLASCRTFLYPLAFRSDDKFDTLRSMLDCMETMGIDR
jgi:hypothetical protein